MHLEQLAKQAAMQEHALLLATAQFDAKNAIWLPVEYPPQFKQAPLQDSATKSTIAMDHLFCQVDESAARVNADSARVGSQRAKSAAPPRTLTRLACPVVPRAFVPPDATDTRTTRQLQQAKSGTLLANNAAPHLPVPIPRIPLDPSTPLSRASLVSLISKTIDSVITDFKNVQMAKIEYSERIVTERIDGYIKARAEKLEWSKKELNNRESAPRSADLKKKKAAKV